MLLLSSRLSISVCRLMRLRCTGFISSRISVAVKSVSLMSNSIEAFKALSGVRNSWEMLDRK